MEKYSTQQNTKTFVGIDAHKKDHYICILHPDGEEIEEFTVRNQKREIQRFVKRLKKKSSGEISICYEAGPCGFDLQRQLMSDQIHCDVIAPSLIPVKPGDRVKTDRRDARKLAELYRAGMLTMVHPPSREEEAVRDLSRCRQAAKERETKARHQLSKFLLRHCRIYSKSNWTQVHRRWLKSLEWEDEIERLVFEDYLLEVEHCAERVKNLDQELERVSHEKPYEQIVGWLRCFKGIDVVSAMTLVCELFSIERFHDPGDLMSYLGLTPSENSSGGTIRRGSITKAGNKRARRILIEASWHYRHRPIVSKALSKRRENQPRWVTSIADKAMRRLHKRYEWLIRNGKHKNVAVTAVARELVGFIWSVYHVQAEVVSKENRGHA